MKSILITALTIATTACVSDTTVSSEPVTVARTIPVMFMIDDAHGGREFASGGATLLPDGRISFAISNGDLGSCTGEESLNHGADMNCEDGTEIIFPTAEMKGASGVSVQRAVLNDAPATLAIGWGNKATAQATSAAF